VRGLLDVLEELRLGSTRVSQQEDVDVPSEAQLAVDVLGNAAKEREGYRRLDILVSIN
jgi:hypothetical protein